MKKLLVIGAILVLLAGGCDRHIESRNPVRSLPVAPATPSSLSAVINSQSLTLGWEVTSSTGIDQFRVYRSTDSTSGFVLIDSTVATSITLSGMALNRLYFFQVASVTQDGIEGHRSETISARATVLSISINSNSIYTKSRSVSVRLISNIPTSHVILSEDSAFGDSVVLAYAAQVTFNLSGGDGPKTVYARFAFLDGSRSGDPVSDDIILDTRASIRSVTFTPTMTTFATGDTITFSLDAGEPDGAATVSFGTVSGLPLFNDGTNGDNSAGDSIFTGRFIVPPDMNLTDGEVTGYFNDEAGNAQAQLVALQRLDIASVLVPVDLMLVEPLSTYEMNLLWTKAITVKFLSYRIFRGFGTSVTDDSALVATITNINTTTLVDTGLTADTRYSYAVYLRDQLGQDTASNILDGTTEANLPPEPVTVAGSLGDDGASAVLSWSVSSERDFDSYRVFRATGGTVTEADLLVGYLGDRMTTTFSDYIPASMDTAWYRVYVYDRHGAFTGSNVVSVAK
ncbi:MAG: fibronectin type III domain-containing protein [Candidatus Zixiibacteriota bacterium]|nr:MAG: fibronectin type III domain-containing protein [candidate division Zixibacteria bacterium]